MGKVISLKSGKQLGGSDSKENDELASRKGEYIGSLSLKVAEEIRELQGKLNLEQIQINQVIEKFEEHYKQYIYEINSNLTKFNCGIKSFNHETEKLLIGEDGHMWIVKNSDLNIK